MPVLITVKRLMTEVIMPERIVFKHHEEEEMHNRPLRIIVLLSLIAIYPTLIYGAENDGDVRPWIELTLRQPSSCMSLSGYYLPKKRLKQIYDMMKQDNIKSFDGKICKGAAEYDELIIMYQEEIENNLTTYSHIDNSMQLLGCTANLNDSMEKLISYFHSREIEIFNTPPCNDTSKECKETISANNIISQKLTAITNNSLKKVCSNYNKIAFEFERNGMLNNAEEIYRKVLRNCEQFPGCFKEAEISLQTMRNQK